MRVAGLAPVEGVPGLENIDCTNLVDGHMGYRVAMPRLLREVGWEVLSEEFDEIENPDPENHEERQRELIREIEHARREVEQQREPMIAAAAQEGEEEEEKKKNRKKKYGFSLFRRRVSSTTKEQGTHTSSNGKSTGLNDPNDSVDGESVLFDTDAMGPEFALDDSGVKQLESGLPISKLNLDEPAAPTKANTTEPTSPERARTGSGASSVNLPPYSLRNDQLDLMVRPPQRSYSSSLQRSPDDFSEPGFSRSSSAGLTSPLTTSAGVGSILSMPATERNVWADGCDDQDDIQMSFE